MLHALYPNIWKECEINLDKTEVVDDTVCFLKMSCSESQYSIKLIFIPVKTMALRASDITENTDYKKPCSDCKAIIISISITSVIKSKRL